MISVCLLIFALVDYLVPILISILCNAQSWTGQKEKKLIEVCQNLSTTILQIQSTWTCISKIRHDRPNIVSLRHSLFYFKCTVNDASISSIDDSFKRKDTNNSNI